MSNTQISLDPDQAAASANLLAQGQKDATELVGQVEARGVSVGPTAAFKISMTNWVVNARRDLDDISEELAWVQSQLNATVLGLVEQDETLATETATYAAAVETVPTAEKPAPTSTVPHGAADAAGADARNSIA